jgi:hypothetical protein
MPRKKRTTRSSAKTARKSNPTPKARRAARPVYSEATLRGLSLDQSQARSAALEALSLMRSKGFSLTRAAREVELSRDAVQHWTGASIKKQGRRFVAKSSDKLVRIMKVITPRGVQSEAIFDSRVASKLGAYNAAVKEALRGNVAALKPFRGKRFRTGGKRGFPFVTDMRVLKRLAQAGELPEYTIYAQ